MTFARHAAIVLANAQVYWDARQLSENLEQALHSRSTINYAIGILIRAGAGGRSPEEAFQILVRASQRENRKLRDIAAEIVRHAGDRKEPGITDH
jgi:AmiR/NasT family two-component response regulator